MVHILEAGKTFNSAKSETLKEFRAFVDANSQPNSRSADSTGPTSYFTPNFRTIQIPKASVVDYDERAKSSVLGEFNHAQTEAGKKECSNDTSHNSLKASAKVAKCPHKEDIAAPVPKV